MSNNILIKKVNKLNYKSYDNYCGPDDEFRRANIIYGANGNGKSSFAKGLEDECKAILQENEYVAFNSKYINDNFYIEDRKTLKGVKISVGKENKSALVEVDKLKKEISEKQNQLKQKEKLNYSLLSDLEKELDLIFDQTRGTAKIKRKSFDLNNPKKTIDLWISDYEEANKLFPSYNFLIPYSDKSIGASLEEVQNYIIPRFPVSPAFSEEIETIMNTKYDIITESIEILNWLEVGAKYHLHSSTCKFCGSSFDSENRLIEIEKMLHNSCKNDIDKLIKFADSLSLYTQQVENYKIDNFVLLSDEDFISVYERIRDNREIRISKIKKYIKKVLEKVDDMSIEHSLNGLSHAYFSGEEINAEVQDKRLKLLKRLTNENDKEAVLVKGTIGYKIMNDASINRMLEQITKEKKTYILLEKEINNIQTQINSLNDSISDIEYFADEANKILTFLGLDIKISTAKNSDYVIKKSKGGTIIDFNNISEGEKNLLAFLFFYLSTCPTQASIDPKIKVLIIDDAVSSLDSNNKTYLLVLISSLLENKNCQSFLFTHCWEDSINLSYGKSGNDEYGFYQCIKKDGKSQVCSCKMKGSIYKTFFKEIYYISTIDADDISDDEAVHAPNTMRRIIESYMRFNYNVELATEKQKEIILSIFNCGNTALSNNDETKLNTLLRLINVQSHGSLFPITPQKNEISTSAKYLMRIFKEHDKCHYDKMKE